METSADVIDNEANLIPVRLEKKKKKVSKLLRFNNKDGKKIRKRMVQLKKREVIRRKELEA